MMNKTLASLTIIVFSQSITAADKYGPPAPPVPANLTGVISISPGTQTRDGNNNVLITSSGKYNYDTDCSFESITLTSTYAEPNAQPVTGPSAVISNEATLPPGGNWQAAILLPNVANNTVVDLKAKLTLYVLVPDPNDPNPDVIKRKKIKQFFTVESPEISGAVPKISTVVPKK